MREILFRGKDIKGNWHIGLLAHIENDWYISNKAGVSTAFEVIPETVGQYTGLTDKSGKKIFDGDIIKTQPFRDKACSLHSKTKQHIGVIKYRADKQGAEWYVDIDNCGKYTHCTYSEFFGCEVIGNLHDNPELLKGGAEK
jgi:uncharacterized phage protein (TIGR01671 family)